MNVDRASASALLFALVLGAGVAAGGFLAGNGFARARAADRYVTVKGVSEREVRADLAIWPIHLSGADNDLGAANTKLTKNVAGVRAFLVRHGIDTSRIQVTDFSAIDAYTNKNNNSERRVGRGRLPGRARPDLHLHGPQRAQTGDDRRRYSTRPRSGNSVRARLS